MDRLTKKKTLQDDTEYYMPVDMNYLYQGYISDKLGKLEDIMEKYGIEDLTNLDFLLGCMGRVAKDRDTWKEACELACKEIRLLNEHLKYNLMSEEFAEKRQIRLNNLETEFYQQAQKELNNDR